MREEGLDFFLISSTDEYFNEYISLSENSGYILSGFSGSTGEWLVSSDNVFLFVDGRYHLQADNETDSSLISVEKVGMDKTLFGAMLEKILLLAKNGQQIGIIANKTSVSQFEKLQEELEIKNIKLCDYDYDPVLKFANPEKQETISRLRYIPLDITGCSSDEKLDVLTKQLNRDNLDFFILTKLDEIAYLTNLRGNEIPYSSSFKAKAILSKDKSAYFC
ncbi:MAG: aminopeptidase P family N-terminal domain-containing protein [Ignavibacteriales bacterium]|nr:aminopeptidase P family N-terminal domain-containing protein [Ignavibacteriales bacterium]